MNVSITSDSGVESVRTLSRSRDIYMKVRQAAFNMELSDMSAAEAAEIARRLAGMPGFPEELARYGREDDGEVLAALQRSLNPNFARQLDIA